MKKKLDEQGSIILNSPLTSLKMIIEITTKSNVDSLHDENERNRRDLGLAFHNEEVDLVKNNQDNDFNGNKLTNLDSVTVSRAPSSDNDLSRKRNIENELGKNTIL